MDSKKNQITNSGNTQISWQHSAIFEYNPFQLTTLADELTRRSFKVKLNAFVAQQLVPTKNKQSSTEWSMSVHK